MVYHNSIEVKFHFVNHLKNMVELEPFLTKILSLGYDIDLRSISFEGMQACRRVYIYIYIYIFVK